MALYMVGAVRLILGWVTEVYVEAYDILKSHNDEGGVKVNCNCNV